MVEVQTIEYSHQSEELIHLLSVTLYLVRKFTKRQVPRGGVFGGLVILAHPRLMVTLWYSIYSNPSRGQRSIQQLEFSTNFQFLKNTRISQNTTPITNRLKLLTPIVQTLLKSIPQNYCKLLLYLNSNLNYLLMQDTQLSATSQLSKQDKHDNSREFQNQPK